MYVVAWYYRNNPSDLHCGSHAASKELIQVWCNQMNAKYPDLYHYPMSTSERAEKFEKIEGGT